MRRVLGPLAFALFCLSLGQVHATALTDNQARQVDKIAVEALARSQVPSVSVAIVRDGQIVFAKAYGARALSPYTPATSDDRYMIGSISKQFTATTVLMLADRGKLSLDDKVSRYLPGLSGADQITLRQALSHTAGYSGYFTLDFTPDEGRRLIAPQEIARRWGGAPLDFSPGSQWRYSNTGYTLAGLIVEQLEGRPLASVLRAKVFTPLNMTTAADVDERPLRGGDARGYTRYVFGAPRPSRAIGRGWLFAAGGLAMSAPDLARWDISVIDRRLLSASGYATQQTAVKLPEGASSGYGLGVYVDDIRGRRRVQHDGSIDGFGAENRIYPDDRAAVVVLANADFGSVQHQIADQIEALLFPAAPANEAKTTPAAPSTPPPPPVVDEQALAMAHQLTAQLRAGELDRALLTVDANAYFSQAALDDYRTSLAALGEPTSFIQLRHDVIGGLNASLYELTWPDRKLIAVLRRKPQGKVAAFVMFPP